MSELRVTHTSTVTEDQIDHLGHMNVRFYAANAREATAAMLADLGAVPPGDLLVADTYTRHHQEQLLGSRLEVRSGVIEADAGGVRLYHELANAESGALAASFVHGVPVEEMPTFTGASVVVPAHGGPRSISLAMDPLALAPTLDVARASSLAIRRERDVDEVDCEGSDRVAAHMVPHLIWGGDNLAGTEPEYHHVGPNGENMGWATMETRVCVNHLPALGSRIQSFSATVAIRDKTTQMVMWAFDVATGELLVSFEVVNLAFNIDERRAMSIPPEMRAAEQERLRPEFGVG